MNLLISIVNKFTESSPAYQVRKWNQLAKDNGFHFVTFIGEGAYDSLKPHLPELTSTTFIHMKDHPNDLRDLFLPVTHSLQSEFDKLVDHFKPEKITCNMDFILFKYIEKYPCKKQLFVRQFFTKIHYVMESHPKLKLNISEIEKSLVSSTEEARCLQLADMIITNNSLTATNIKELFHLDAMVIDQYRDPKPFIENYSAPNFNDKRCYHVGRTDHIKNVSVLRPNKYPLLLIGQSLLSSEVSQLPNTTHVNEFQKFEDWYPRVKSIPFSVNPSIYETNGFAVQEALMMGKIVLVQENSGGNCLHIKHGENGFVVDFETTDYESMLDSLSLAELTRISNNARQTIDTSLYAKSVSEYVEQIV
jgi:glycosyltransferase involved in cell wall biosynthesis